MKLLILELISFALTLVVLLMLLFCAMEKEEKIDQARLDNFLKQENRMNERIKVSLK